MKVEELFLKVMNGQRLCSSSDKFGCYPCTQCPYFPVKIERLTSGACTAELANDSLKLRNITKVIDNFLISMEENK